MTDLHTPALTAAARDAAELTGRALAAVTPELLPAPTPCADYDVRALLDHLAWAALLSQRAATRTPLDHDWSSHEPAPFLAGVPAAAWATAIARELEAAADAWTDRAAWEGDTMIAATALPAAVAGPMMLAEVVLHGWDLARGLAVDHEVPDTLGEATLAAVQPLVAMGREGGWYGPEVAVPADAPAFSRALGLTGRDPAWRA